MTDLDYAIEVYAEQHTTPLDPVLESLYRETYLHAMNPRMMAGPVQGRFLQFLSQLLRPKRILEIGTFTGFSTICMARGLAEGGTMVTIEANREQETIIRKYLDLAGVSDRVALILGDAKQVIPDLKESFDLAYIDADKLSYPAYYEMVMEKLNPEGIILADNVLWDGKVLKTDAKERDTQTLQAFNERIQQDPRVENVLLPLRDGLMMIKKRF